MVDAREMKLKKVAVTEEDICTLLQRYTATTVLALLREVAQFPAMKVDWQALVEKTKTGIKTAREYQMLWRHLAYRKPLIENVDPEDQPSDDDSDLEYELAACPPVSNEAALEASNCVKVLAFGSANESSIPNSSSLEGRAFNANSSNLSSENPHASGIFGDGLDANGLPINRKRRKPWSEEEDLELITAVQKFGEGSWAAILKGEFKGNRNATQLAQLAHISSFIVGNETTGTNSPKISGSITDLPITGAIVPLSQPQPSPVTCATSSVKSAPVASMPKARPQKKVSQPSVSAESIQATAVVAGARIVSSSDAASILKAVQSKNAVHIIRGGGSLIKTSAAGSSSPLPPNVHFIRTGLASTPTLTASAGTASFVAGQQAKGSAIRPPLPPAAVSQLPKAKTSSAVGMERINAAQQTENRTSNAVDVQGSDTKITTRAQEDNASLPQCMPKALLDKCRATSTGADVGISKQMADIDNSQCAMNKNVTRNELKDDSCKQAVECPVLKVDYEKLSVNRSLESCTSVVNGTHEVPPTMFVEGGAAKMEVSRELSKTQNI